MKTIINIAAAVGAFGAAGCFPEMKPPTFEGEGLPPEVDLCPGCLESQELRGELMLIVNTKPTGAASNFQSNFPLDEKGRYVGNALYLYDPTRACPDGESGCRLAKLGNLWLDHLLRIQPVPMI